MTSDLDHSAAAGERELFLEALEKGSASERAAFLDLACDQDRDLRERIEQLLREHEEAGSFLETPAVVDPRGRTPSKGSSGSGTEAFAASVTEKAGDWIGRYKLLQQIGEGGCGVVYMAEQEQPVRRRVALKVIKMGMDTKSVIARFEAERQALAMMDHPHIARVLDAGATETGRPFFVMELVRGIRITDYCNQNNLPTHERLTLFIQVCQAIQHAHQKGVIHRDIKPSNILVTLHDGVPVPKVIDFGIAKATEQRLTDKTLFTEFTAFIGTPAYMSPEQAEMSGLDIDTRSDIYALGVLLYELLTGKTPFDAESLLRAGLDECRRTIREQEPVRPSTRLETMLDAELSTAAKQRHTEAVKLIHLLRGDLDWVVMKSLEKDRTRRYPTANDLAWDIQRYLANEPVLARPPSNVYRFQKLLRRHRGAFAAAAAIAVTLVGGASLSTWLAIRATRAEKQEFVLRRQAEAERERAEQEKALARLNEYVANVNLAQTALKDGNVGRAVQLVNKHWPKPNEPDLRGFEWRYLWQLCQGDEHIRFPHQGAGVYSVAASPDGKWLAAGLREKLNIWKLNTRTLAASFPVGAVSLAFSSDSRVLVSGGEGRDSTVRVWQTSDWTEQKVLAGNSGPISLSSDGKRLASSSRDGIRQGVRVWDTVTWTELRFFRDTSGPLTFSPDGSTLAAESRSGIKLLPIDPAGVEVTLRTSGGALGPGGGWMRSARVIAFSPDGKQIVARRRTSTTPPTFGVGVWDVRSGEEIGAIPENPGDHGHTSEISSLAFSPDGHVLATGSWDHAIRLWDFESRRHLKLLQGHLNEVWSVTFASDNQSLISAAKDGGLYLWPSPLQEKDSDPLFDPLHPLAFSQDGRILAGVRENNVVFLNLASQEIEQEFSIAEQRPDTGQPGRAGPGPGGPFAGQSIALSADLKVLVHTLSDGTLRILNTDSRESTVLQVASTNAVRRVDWVGLSPDGRFLVAGGRGRNVRWWDLHKDTNSLLPIQADRILMSPDSRTLAAFYGGTNVQLWDLSVPSLRTHLVMDPAPGFAFAFSPDGRVLATTDFPGVGNAIRLWNVATGKPLGVCMGHKQGVFAVAFSPDSKTLASSSSDSTLKLWNVATQQELLTFESANASNLIFSPDGRLLTALRPFFAQSGRSQVYRAPTLNEVDDHRTL